MPTRQRRTGAAPRSAARGKRKGWPARSIEAAIACSRIAIAPPPSGKVGRRAQSIASNVRKFYLG